MTGDDALLAEENGAVGAGGAGEFHEGGEIEGVAAEGALADDEVVEDALVEPGREIAAEDGVFAMIDTGGAEEAQAVGGGGHPRAVGVPGFEEKAAVGLRESRAGGGEDRADGVGACGAVCAGGPAVVACDRRGRARGKHQQRRAEGAPLPRITEFRASPAVTDEVNAACRALGGTGDVVRDEAVRG